MIIFSRRASYLIYNYILSNSKPGYWLLPLNSCPLVPITFLTANVPFKLVDISLDDYCMNDELILDTITDNKCIGILYIYTYGYNNNKSDLFNIIKSKRSDIKIIEDKCLNFPSFSEKDASSFADITIYSTGYGKTVDLGFGGFAVARPDIEFYKKKTGYAKNILNNLERSYKKCFKQCDILERPSSSWIDDRLLPVTIDEYKKLVINEKTKARIIKKEINNIYKEKISNVLWLTVNDSPVDDWRFNIKIIHKKNTLLNKIVKKKLFSSNHYQPVDKIFNAEVIGGTKNSYFLYNQIVNLFNYKYFNPKMAIKLTEIINKILLDGVAENGDYK